MLNTEYYGKEYLKESDSNIVDEIELLKDEILSDDVVEEFLEGVLSLNGKTAKALVKDEVINPFRKALGDRIDIYICDLIIERIDGYAEDEYIELKKAADEKKRLMLAGASV